MAYGEVLESERKEGQSAPEPDDVDSRIYWRLGLEGEARDLHLEGWTLY